MFEEKSCAGIGRNRNKWNGVSPGHDDGEETVAMEIDRLEGKPKGKPMNFQGKGKGSKSTEKSCYVCGHQSHFAKDCWQAVHNVPGNVVSGSAPSDWTTMTIVLRSRMHLRMPQIVSTSAAAAISAYHIQSCTCFRDFFLNGDPGHFVFDLRDLCTFS